jgi:ubiquinone/menaquinone biosynthesis C-methylase UbiE
MSATDKWSLSGAGPETYEQYQVPSTFEPLAHMLLARVGLVPGQRVLDIACGTGIVSRLAAQQLGAGGQVIGVDFNQAMLDVALANAPSTGAAIAWRQGDAGALPCGDGAFDIVVCQQGLQFFPDKVGALREARRVLAADGRAWFVVWRSTEHSPLNRAISETVHRHLGPEAEKISLAPFSLGDGDRLRSLFAEAGFRDVEIEAAQIIRNMLPPDVSIPALLTSLPIGPQIAALDEAVRLAMVAEVSEALTDYRTEEGLSVPQGTHFISAAG